MDYLQNLGGPASFVKIIGPGVVILSQAIVMPNLPNPKPLKLNKKNQADLFLVQNIALRVRIKHFLPANFSLFSGQR